MKKLLMIAFILLLTTSLVLGSCSEPEPEPTPTSSPTQTPAPTQEPTSTPSPTQQPTASPEPSPTQEPVSRYGGVLKIVSDSVPGAPGWPPEIIGASMESPMMCLEGLLRDDISGGVYPWLAESYDVADDYTSITFKLRKGIRFHDGSDFNAEVVKWNLDSMIEANRSPFWDSVDIVDDYTVRVNVNEFNNIVLRTFGDANLIISKESYDKNGLDWVRVNPVGTGPFKFVSFSRDVGFKTERNPDYWRTDDEGNQLPYLDGVEYVYVVDPTTQKAVIQSGEADAIVVPLGKVMADYQELGMKVEDDAVVNIFLMPDTKNPDSPWYNKKVREAAEYAIDREAIAKGLGHGFWQAPYQVPARAYPVYESDYALARKYDPEKAKQLMAEAGYADGFSTTIIVNPISGSNDACIAIQNYLSQIGIESTMEFPEFSAYQQSYIFGANGWENGVLVQACGGQPNYNASLDVFLGSGRLFASIERTPEFMEKYNKSLSSPEMDIELVRDMCDQIIKDSTWIPVWESGKNWVYQPYITDAGYGERSQSYYWKPEQTWIKK